MENLHEKTFGNVVVVQNSNYKWGVLDLEGNEIVPFGKYRWIDGFDSGYARVNIKDAESGNKKWGIINTQGEEVVAPVFDNIWNFYEKNRETSKMEKDGKTYWFNLKGEEVHHETTSRDYSSYDDYERDYGSHYGEFAGTYAQDVMGYSDDVINDVFEGDPDAYWNID